MFNQIYSYLSSKLQSSHAKYGKKHQNNKTSYGVKAFPKYNMLLFYILKNSMFYNEPKMITQNSPMINSNSNGDENYVN